MSYDCQVFVGNVSHYHLEENLMGTFGGHHRVKEVEMICDRETDIPLGFAYVTFFEPKEVQLAIDEFNGTGYMERKLIVRKADRRNDKLNYQREGDGLGCGDDNYGGRRSCGGGSGDGGH
ncbi:putative RNA-binding protein RbpD [Clavelina lepadiformis]|uniref:Serine/arginine-rich splicing factor 2 n=1 Tax=Clavelina lepadiformis TaxID=159417 RepID=A0ABP0FMS5_CLALP